LPCDFDGVVGDGRLFLGRSCGGFGRFFSGLRFFFLAERICGGDGKRKAAAHSRVRRVARLILQFSLKQETRLTEIRRILAHFR